MSNPFPLCPSPLSFSSLSLWTIYLAAPLRCFFYAQPCLANTLTLAPRPMPPHYLSRPLFCPNSKDAWHRSPSSPVCNRLYLRCLLLFVLVWPLLSLLNGLVFASRPMDQDCYPCSSLSFEQNALLKELLFLFLFLSPFRWSGSDAQGHTHFRVND